MAKHRRHERTRNSDPSRNTRQLGTLDQMRDSLNRSRLLARRFDDFNSMLNRLRQVSNRLAVEDLRRDRYVQEQIGYQTYRQDDAREAPVVRRVVDTHPMRIRNMSFRMRDEFKHARRTLVCQRRHARREVLFAMRRTGKGGAKNRRARWTDKSYISCKRGR